MRQYRFEYVAPTDNEDQPMTDIFDDQGKMIGSCLPISRHDARALVHHLNHPDGLYTHRVAGGMVTVYRPTGQQLFSMIFVGETVMSELMFHLNRFEE